MLYRNIRCNLSEEVVSQSVKRGSISTLSLTHPAKIYINSLFLTKKKATSDSSSTFLSANLSRKIFSLICQKYLFGSIRLNILSNSSDKAFIT